MTKRSVLTIEKQKRFISAGRGQGIGKNYTPWIRIARSEISSTGRSTLLLHNGRQHHFLSNGELTCFLLATMLPGYVEVREQFPLSLVRNEHEVNAYTDSYEHFYPGTLEISATLGIKHPRVRSAAGGFGQWIMSTDLLITLCINGVYKLVAVSYKPKLPSSLRALELLRIEKHYWETRGVQWLFITFDLFGRELKNQLAQFRIFALDESVKLDIELMEMMVQEIYTHSISYVDFINQFLKKQFTEEVIKKAFWYGFWIGLIPIKIEGKFNPCIPMQLYDRDEFFAMNPIYTRRSSWI